MQPTQLEPEVAQPRSNPKKRHQIWLALLFLAGLIALGYGLARLVDFVRTSCILP